MNGDLPRIHEMERTAQSFGHGFLDGPKQGGGMGRMSPGQHQGLVKLLVMEDPVDRVFSGEFVGSRHVDADSGIIPTEGRPKFPSSFAEGDGWPPMLFPQGKGLAEGVVSDPNRESTSGE
jgi:hypothetical protein